MPGDSVTPVNLTSAGALDIAPVAGSPYSIIPFNAVGTGLANYTITFVPGALTVTPATAVISVSGYTVPYDGLPHTATGTATGVLGEPLSADLDLTATTHTAVGVTLDAWTFHDPAGNYVDAGGTVTDTITAGALTITAANQTKPYGTTFTFAGTEFTVSGLQGTDSVTSVTLTSAGAPATAAGQPLPDHPLGRRRHGSRQLHDHLCHGHDDGHRGAAHDHRQQPDQALRRDVHLRRHRVHRDRSPGRRTP